MDKNKTSATASSSSEKHVEKKDEKHVEKKDEKHGEKKDENFLTKTAHSIREKVHELTDDVKEKTHNLTHSGDAKKEKKDKDKKENSPKEQHPPSAVKKDNERDADKSGASGSKPSSGAAASASATEKKDTAPATSSRNPSDKPVSRDAAGKSSDDHKDAASKPSDDKSATKPLGAPSNNDPKSSTDNSNKPTDGADTTNKLSSGPSSTDHIHISFDDVTTVNELLDRIDETIERTKVVVDNTATIIGPNVTKTKSAPAPSPADLEKKPVKKAEDNENKEDKKEGEPIRLNYNDLHTIEDILVRVNKQPGSRKVVFEHTSDDSGSATAQKQTNENDDPSGPPKSILKTSQDPSSLDTSTKVASFQDDEIHLNIEDVSSLDDLLDRIDAAVIHVPLIIDSKPQGEKRQAPQASNQNDKNNQQPAGPSVPAEKKEAPPSPNNQKNDTVPPNNKQAGDDKVPVIKVPEHEFEGTNDNKQPASSSSTSEKPKEKGPSDDWL